MVCKDVIRSRVDRTQKFVLLNDKGQVLEVSYINKNDGKHILCVPTQTNCRMACSFCHTTALAGKIPTKNLEPSDIVDAVTMSLNMLGVNEDEERTLLISYMGNGEPMEAVEEIVSSMRDIKRTYEKKFKVVRFAVSTLMPRGGFPQFAFFADEVHGHGLDVKLHVSLHFTKDYQRREWMPMAETIRPTLDMMKWYQSFTGNPVELHYTPIANVNDHDEDIQELQNMLSGYNIPIKFLKFSPLSTSSDQPSQRVPEIQAALGTYGIHSEYYDPPGRDIGSSCGMFLAEYYTKYTTIKPAMKPECKHETTIPYRWEHDDGYGKQKWIDGKECTKCHKVCLWTMSTQPSWHDRSECHQNDYGGHQ